MTRTSAERAEQLQKRLARRSLAGLWQRRNKRLGLEPHVCHWEDVYPCLVEAGEIIELNKDTEWKAKDCFIVPPWYWHQFENTSSTEASILFSMSDRPILEAQGFYREEVADARTRSDLPNNRRHGGLYVGHRVTNAEIYA